MSADPRGPAAVSISVGAKMLLDGHVKGRETVGADAANGACLASIQAAAEYLVQFHGPRVAYAVLTEFAEGVLQPELPA